MDNDIIGSGVDFISLVYLLHCLVLVWAIQIVTFTILFSYELLLYFYVEFFWVCVYVRGGVGNYLVCSLS